MFNTRKCTRCHQKETISKDAEYCVDCFDAIFIDDPNEEEDEEEMFDECLSCGAIWGVGSEEWQFQHCDACGWHPGLPIDIDFDDDDDFDFEPIY